LTTAVDEENIPMVKALLKYGADINKENPTSQFTPLIVACWRGSTNIVRLLLNTAGINVNFKRTKVKKPEKYSCTNIYIYIYALSSDVKIIIRKRRYLPTFKIHTYSHV
jgi:ankyrin repeat protein